MAAAVSLSWVVAAIAQTPHTPNPAVQTLASSAATPRPVDDVLDNATGADNATGLFGNSPARLRREAIDALPLNQLTRSARERIERVVESPTLYRRLPTQSVLCERDMFLVVARNPELLVGIWDLMGITTVQVRRTGEFQLQAEDGSGTSCLIDLVYGDAGTHVFVAKGKYEGRMTAKPIAGEGVFVLRSRYVTDADGVTTVTAMLDSFVKFEGIGVDLVARTLGGVIGKSADNNFAETARFISQISQASEHNPGGMIDVARRLPQVDADVKKQFAMTILTVARKAAAVDPTHHTAVRRDLVVDVVGPGSENRPR